MSPRRTARAAAGLAILLTCAPAGRRPPLPAPAAPAAAPHDIDVTLFLIGDAGAPARLPAGEPVLAALHSALTASPGAVVLFLGDNVYPRGMPDPAAPERVEAERRLGAQLEALRGTGARGIFIPGNHDWDRHGVDGWAAVRRAEAFIGAGSASQLPPGGCPGPAVVDAGTTVRVVALDTQWWLHDGPKPLHPDSQCPADAPDEVLAALEAAGVDAAGRVLIVAAHHPLRTGGPHGGYFGIDDHLFPLRAVGSWLWLPLPLIGSMYPIARANGISNQDTPNSTYQRMAAGLESTLVRIRPRPLVYAAGHEHGLQVIGGSSARYLLVSGGGTYGHASRLVWLDSTHYARGRSGFIRLDVLRDRRTRLGVFVVDAAGRATEEFSLWLQ
jgi:hypothetical protein